ncbi:hypothetical protein [Candidatus Nanohalovita haloferacivicina]|uniref:hypothetical protein n=1 Tax=Candidatus Nanohalovita haloferacivicina TaxID=2978046 RepID=UPI00325FDA54|nr:hypothetical protein HBNXNv_0675 [Candidatus Nanohalobia archaeon BNXNv]
MSAGRNLVKSLILVSTLLITTSLAASAPAWEVTPMNAPDSYSTISPAGATTQYVEIRHRDTGDPITKDYLERYEGRAEWFYLENGTLRNSGDLKYLNGAVWYVHKTVGDKDGKFRFEAQRGSPIDEEANSTKQITISNVKITILTDMSQAYFPGREDARIEVNVTNSTSGDFLTTTDLDVEITNTTYFNTQAFPDDSTNQKYRLYSLIIPEAVQQEYSLRVKATANGETATTTQMISTRDYLNTSVSTVEAQTGCNQQSMPTKCEEGAELDLGLNVTSAHANNVSMAVMRKSVEGNNLETISSSYINKSEETGLYEGNLTFPDLDTSSYSEEIYIKFTAKNNYSTSTRFYNITKARFALTTDMIDTAYQGSEYQLKFGINKRYTGTPVENEDFASADITVDYPNGSEYKTFSKSDLSYDNETGWATGSMVIPQGTPNGTYTIAGVFSNQYGETVTVSPVFDLKETTQIFNTTDELNVSIVNRKNYSENFTITNQLSNSITINATAMSEISGITTINDGNNIEIAPNNETNVTVNFDVDEVEDYEGEILLEDMNSEFSRTIDVNLNSPDCQITNNSLCADRESINVTLLGPREVTESFEIYNIGPESSVQTEIYTTGQISDYVTTSVMGVDLADSHSIDVNYSLQTPVNVSGEIVVNSSGQRLSIPTRLAGDFAEPEVDLEIMNDSMDIGVIQSSSSQFQLIAKNNGSTNINYIQSETGMFEVSEWSTVSVDAQEPFTTQVTRDSYGTVEREVTYVAYQNDPENSSETGSTDTVQITARFMPETQAASENITSWVTRLQGQAFSTGVINQLETARQNATKMEDSLSKGDDIQAYNTYQSTINNLESLETQINNNNQQQDDEEDNQEGDNNNGGSDDPGTDTPPTDTEQKSGGMGILPIILVVLILVVGGFIFYTSYIPEPGDPLYEYLGEE